jgi:glutathione peroxidase-family protein
MMSDDVKVSKGLGLPVVALPCVRHMPAKSEDENEAVTCPHSPYQSKFQKSEFCKIN